MGPYGGLGALELGRGYRCLHLLDVFLLDTAARGREPAATSC